MKGTCHLTSECRGLWWYLTNKVLATLVSRMGLNLTSTFYYTMKSKYLISSSFLSFSSKYRSINSFVWTGMKNAIMHDGCHPESRLNLAAGHRTRKEVAMKPVRQAEYFWQESLLPAQKNMPRKFNIQGALRKRLLIRFGKRTSTFRSKPFITS